MDHLRNYLTSNLFLKKLLNNQIVSPHTFNFISALFQQLNLETISLATYNETENVVSLPEEDEQGESIRYMRQNYLLKIN